MPLGLLTYLAEHQVLRLIAGLANWRGYERIYIISGASVLLSPFDICTVFVAEGRSHQMLPRGI